MYKQQGGVLICVPDELFDYFQPSMAGFLGSFQPSMAGFLAPFQPSMVGACWVSAEYGGLSDSVLTEYGGPKTGRSAKCGGSLKYKSAKYGGSASIESAKYGGLFRDFICLCVRRYLKSRTEETAFRPSMAGIQTAYQPSMAGVVRGAPCDLVFLTQACVKQLGSPLPEHV
jgi:hypothetical protein